MLQNFEEYILFFHRLYRTITTRFKSLFAKNYINLPCQNEFIDQYKENYIFDLLKKNNHEHTVFEDNDERYKSVYNYIRLKTNYYQYFSKQHLQMMHF